MMPRRRMCAVGDVRVDDNDGLRSHKVTLAVLIHSPAVLPPTFMADQQKRRNRGSLLAWRIQAVCLLSPRDPQLFTARRTNATCS